MRWQLLQGQRSERSNLGSQPICRRRHDRSHRPVRHRQHVIGQALDDGPKGLDEPAGRQFILNEAQAEQGHALAGDSGLNGMAFVGKSQLGFRLVRDPARGSEPSVQVGLSGSGRCHSKWMRGTRSRSSGLRTSRPGFRDRRETIGKHHFGAKPRIGAAAVADRQVDGIALEVNGRVRGAWSCRSMSG